MTNYCSCKDNNGSLLNMFQVQNCSECTLENCKNNPKAKDTTSVSCLSDQPIFGLNVTLFLLIVILQIVIWVIMIFFSVIVLKKCKNKSGVRVAIITLLVLWILLSWIPFLGFLLFIVLLIILIIYNNECKSKK